VACNKVQSPSGTISDCHNLSKIPVVINLSNPGINTLSGIPVFYRINGGPIVSETYPGTLTSSATASYTFSAAANITGVGTYSVKAWANYSADPVASNDTSVSKVVVVAGAIRALPLNEDFETFNLCSTGNNCNTAICTLTNNFINEGNNIDQHDWRTNSGAPPTPGTGPLVDFSPGTATGKYVYLESTLPCQNLTANMLSPCVDLSTLPNSILSFGYHMSGASMGDMYLDVFSKGNWTNGVWSMSGNQGDAWKVANVNLNTWANDTVTFRWRGITGNGGFSDMALDAIFIGTTVGLSEHQSRQRFSVFPNPGTDEFNIMIPGNVTSDLAYTVTDISGRIILSGKAEVSSDNSLAKINLKSFATGVYILRLSCEDRVEYTKLYKI
jgi:hypothetical protein